MALSYINECPMRLYRALAHEPPSLFPGPGIHSGPSAFEAFEEFEEFEEFTA